MGRFMPLNTVYENRTISVMKRLVRNFIGCLHVARSAENAECKNDCHNRMIYHLIENGMVVHVRKRGDRSRKIVRWLSYDTIL